MDPTLGLLHLIRILDRWSTSSLHAVAASRLVPDIRLFGKKSAQIYGGTRELCNRWKRRNQEPEAGTRIVNGCSRAANCFRRLAPMCHRLDRDIRGVA